MRRVLLMGAVILSGIACSSPRNALPQVAEIYSDAAQRHTRNPVIVIHGILGARLEQQSTGKTVWGAFTGRGINPNSRDGARAVALPLDVPASATAYDPTTADIRATGPLEALELDLLFTVVSVNVYANILRTLGAGGYTDNVAVDPFSPAYSEDHYTCFSFFYDWRRDNVENAIRLGEYIQERRVEIQRTATNRVAKLRAHGTPEALAEADEVEAWLREGFRFDIVAHSMGGLVARYFLRYGAQDLPMDGSVPEVTWAGAQEIDRLVMVGTPNFGAMDALRNLVEGFQPAFILPRFHAALLSTMPSIYQLLPRARHGLVVDGSRGDAPVDVFDVALWERNGWGLFDATAERIRSWLLPDASDAERTDTVREYTDWCLRRAKAFHAALDSVPEKPCRARVYLFASDTQETLAGSRLKPRGERLVPTFEDASLFLPGDATVPRSSAVADERFGDAMAGMWLRSPVPWSNVTFLSDDHIGLTSNPHFSNNTLFLLLDKAPPPMDD